MPQQCGGWVQKHDMNEAGRLKCPLTLQCGPLTSYAPASWALVPILLATHKHHHLLMCSLAAGVGQMAARMKCFHSMTEYRLRLLRYLQYRHTVSQLQQIDALVESLPTGFSFQGLENRVKRFAWKIKRPEMEQAVRQLVCQLDCEQASHADAHEPWQAACEKVAVELQHISEQLAE